MANDDKKQTNFPQYLYEQARGAVTGDSGVAHYKNGSAVAGKDDWMLTQGADGSVMVIFQLNAPGKTPLEIQMNIDKNDDLSLMINGSLPENGQGDITIQESRQIAASVKKALDGRLTVAERQGIETMVTRAIDARTLAEARDEGARISPEHDGINNGVYVSEAKNGSLNYIAVETGRGSRVQINTFGDGVSATQTTGDYRGGNKTEKDISANISKQELAAIQTKFKQYSQDGFLSNAEMKDLGQMTTQAASTNAAADKARGGGR